MKNPDSKNDIFALLNEQNKKHLVTVAELHAAYPSKVALIDSCHSGQMAIEMGELGRGASFVFASTVGSNIAVDGDDGGKLFKTLEKLVSAKNKNLCKLDLDKDGIISEREAFASVFAHNAHTSLQRMGDQLYSKMRINEVGQNSKSQLSFGNPSNKCFIKPKAPCPGEKLVGRLNICEAFEEKSKSLVKGLNFIFKDVVNNTNLDFLGGSPALKEKIVINTKNTCVRKSLIEVRPCSGKFECFCPDYKVKITPINKKHKEIYCNEEYNFEPATINESTGGYSCPEYYRTLVSDLKEKGYESIPVDDDDFESGEELPDVESFGPRQLKAYQKFFEDWKNDLAKEQASKCPKTKNCSKEIESLESINLFIIESIKPMFYSSE
jgi:hypothetical protein